MAEEKINSETLEKIVEEITREVLKRILAEGIDVSLPRSIICKQDHQCSGDYNCPKFYKCLGQKHSCTGVFSCSDVHTWKYSQV